MSEWTWESSGDVKPRGAFLKLQGCVRVQVQVKHGVPGEGAGMKRKEQREKEIQGKEKRREG